MRIAAPAPRAIPSRSAVHVVPSLFRADELLRQAFANPRDPRSNEYKAGVLAALRYRIEGAPIAIPYRLGTAPADAFFSGLDEGHRIARREA